MQASSILRSIGWQIAGSAATLSSALWVSWRYGLEAQGEFGFAKSWFDAGAAISALGLPQGLLHLLYRCDVAPHLVPPWLRRSFLVGILLCLPATLLMVATGQPLSALVIASLPIAVAHLLGRSWLLRTRGEEIYGFVTAVPALLVLAGVILAGEAQGTLHYAWILLAAAWLTGVVSLSLVWHSNEQYLNTTTARKLNSTKSITIHGDVSPCPFSLATAPSWPRVELWSTSLQSWMQAALSAALPAGLLSVIAHSDQGARALGEASLGLHVYQLFAVISGYVAPLIFHRIAGQAKPSWGTGIAPQTHHRILLLCATFVLTAASTQTRTLWPSIGLMCLAGVTAVTARLHGTVLLARGNYRELSTQAAWRLVVALLIATVAARFTISTMAIAIALLITEVLTWWRSTHCLALEQPETPNSGQVGPSSR
jgi:uncharacterized membrane protein